MKVAKLSQISLFFSSLTIRTMWKIVQVLISAVILVAVSEISQRLPRLRGLLISLPIVGIRT